MILTKRQIIDIELKKLFKGRIPQSFLKQLMSEPEDQFIQSIKSELNLNLDPIRKHQYIIT